jgi:bifunctional DNase/RNase
MIEVEVEGVRRNFGIHSVFMYTTTLIENNGKRIFPVLVERHEAISIVAALEGFCLPRPQTMNMLTDFLILHNMKLE